MKSESGPRDKNLSGIFESETAAAIGDLVVVSPLVGDMRDGDLYVFMGHRADGVRLFWSCRKLRFETDEFHTCTVIRVISRAP